METFQKPIVKQNFVSEGNFFICGEIDDSIAETIIAPLIKRIEDECLKTIKQPIKFFITCYGGYVKDGFDLITWFDYAKKKGVEIHTYVTSVAFSCGSLIAVSGHKRFASKRAYHGLHFARGTDYSHNPEMMQRNADNFIWMQKELIDIYKSQTKLKNIEKLLIADNYMINGGDALLRAGLIDEII